MWIGFMLSLCLSIVGLCIFFSLNDIYYEPKEEKKSLQELFNIGYTIYYRGNGYTPTKEESEKYNKYIKDYNKRNNIKRITFNILYITIPLFIAILFIFCLSLLCAYIDREYLNKEVEGYKMAKYTIESSINNENIGGLERIELVKQAYEQNQWLGETKYKVQRWYNFHLDKENVLLLEEINLNKGDDV